MTCGKFKGIDIILNENATLFGSHCIDFYPRQASDAFNVLPQKELDEQHFEGLKCRDKDVIGYVATSMGTVYLDNNSSLISLMGREDEEQFIGSYLTYPIELREKITPNVSKFYPIKGSGTCGMQACGTTKYRIEYLYEDAMFLLRGEQIQMPDIGQPVSVASDYALEMFQHFQRIGASPKAVIFTTQGVYLRRIGSSKFERSL